MIEIKVKPMSVNDVWQGKRYKTKKYKAYEKEVYHLLPVIKIPKEGPLKVYYEFGFSSALSDYDNPIKPFQDILQFKYAFDDNRIYDATIKKVKVNKGEEYIKFNIWPVNTEICFNCHREYKEERCEHCY